MNSSSNRQQWTKRVINSALWAAYGDALGFITELATPSSLSARIKERFVDRTIEWRRRIGGKFGVTLKLPSGCYSDDTQLRLAVSRSITQDGYFDVASFASIELPVWRFYALGAGNASQVAARSLSSPRTGWNTNFYSDKKALYCFAGGNGAAMRIQPHVWSSRAYERLELLRNVIHDCIVTHGHPNAIIGAAFHALSLQYAMETGRLPGVIDSQNFLEAISKIPDLICNDPELNLAWLPMWENQAKQSFHREFGQALSQAARDIQIAYDSSFKKEYRLILEQLNAFDTSQRGSGTKTAIIATVLASMIQQPEYSVIEAANALNSDTDTIASMCGALVGAISDTPPQHPIQDYEYIQDEAFRLAGVRSKTGGLRFMYPESTVTGKALNKSEGLYKNGKEICLLGLGPLEFISEPVYQHTKDRMAWQWARLSFGQTILVKRGQTIKEAQIPTGSYTEPKIEKQKTTMAPLQSQNENGPASKLGVNDAFEKMREINFDPMILGKTLLEFADRDRGVDEAIAFAALVAKARNARNKKRA